MLYLQPEFRRHTRRVLGHKYGLLTSSTGSRCEPHGYIFGKLTPRTRYVRVPASFGRSSNATKLSKRSDLDYHQSDVREIRILKHWFCGYCEAAWVLSNRLVLRLMIPRGKQQCGGVRRKAPIGPATYRLSINIAL
jgi:hypothetical protein